MKGVTTMDKTSVNALKRARNVAGITQEKAAEMSGYSAKNLMYCEYANQEN